MTRVAAVQQCRSVRWRTVREPDFRSLGLGYGHHLGGVINGVQTFLRGMIERGQGGHIVNIASGAALVAVTTTLYTTAKYGVVGMSESLGNELAG